MLFSWMFLADYDILETFGCILYTNSKILKTTNAECPVVPHWLFKFDLSGQFGAGAGPDRVFRVKREHSLYALQKNDLKLEVFV